MQEGLPCLLSARNACQVQPIRLSNRRGNKVCAAPKVVPVIVLMPVPHPHVPRCPPHICQPSHPGERNRIPPPIARGTWLGILAPGSRAPSTGAGRLRRSVAGQKHFLLGRRAMRFADTGQSEIVVNEFIRLRGIHPLRTSTR